MVDNIECNSHEASSINNQQFRLNKINEIKYYFIAEIKERELMSKTSFTTVIGRPIGVASASLILHFHCLQDL